MSDGIQFAGEFDLQEALVISPTGEVTDLLTDLMVVEINIFEDNLADIMYQAKYMTCNTFSAQGGGTGIKIQNGEMVVVHALNELVGEITKRSLNGDGEYDYMVHYDRDGSIEWCEYSDLREANDLDNWSLTERECFSLFS